MDSTRVIAGMNQLLGATLAPSTKSVYNRAWVLYQEFAQTMHIPFTGIQQIPIHSNILAMFVSYLHVRGFAPTTLMSYTTAIGYVHKMLGVQDPTSSTLIQKMLGAAMRLSPSVDARLPITMVLLQ
jgi:hypothetical protein